MSGILQPGLPRSNAHDPVIAAVWGFAEATFFFIVPDVFTSRIVLDSPRRGLAACVWATGGALVGGALLFALTRYGFGSQLSAGFALLPGIHPTVEAQAAGLFSRHGLGALFVGAASGIPYKLFVVEAATGGVPFVAFAFLSIAARLARFVAVTGLAGRLGATMFRKCSARTKLAVHAVSWTLFYASYFWAMRAR